MVSLIKQFARILGIISFFAIFIVSLDYDDPFNALIITMATIKGFASAGLFWFAGFVIGDIVFKGVVEDITDDRINKLEGGFVQRFAEIHEDIKVKSFNNTESEQNNKK